MAGVCGGDGCGGGGGAGGGGWALVGWEGQGADAFAARVGGFLSGGALAQLVDGSHQLATFAGRTRDDVLYTQYMIYAQLVVLLAMIAFMVALLVFPPLAPVAKAWIAFFQATGHVTALMFMAGLLASVAAGALFMTALDIGVQGVLKIQFGDGYHWSWQKTGVSAAVGAVGGLISGVVVGSLPGLAGLAGRLAGRLMARAEVGAVARSAASAAAKAGGDVAAAAAEAAASAVTARVAGRLGEAGQAAVSQAARAAASTAATRAVAGLSGELAVDAAATAATRAASQAGARMAARYGVYRALGSFVGVMGVEAFGESSAELVAGPMFGGGPTHAKEAGWGAASGVVEGGVHSATPGRGHAGIVSTAAEHAPTFGPITGIPTLTDPAVAASTSTLGPSVLAGTGIVDGHSVLDGVYYPDTGTFTGTLHTEGTFTDPTGASTTLSNYQASGTFTGQIAGNVTAQPNPANAPHAIDNTGIPTTLRVHGSINGSFQLTAHAPADHIALTPTAAASASIAPATTIAAPAATTSGASVITAPTTTPTTPAGIAATAAIQQSTPPSPAGTIVTPATATPATVTPATVSPASSTSTLVASTDTPGASASAGAAATPASSGTVIDSGVIDSGSGTPAGQVAASDAQAQPAAAGTHPGGGESAAGATPAGVAAASAPSPVAEVLPSYDSSSPLWQHHKPTVTPSSAAEIHGGRDAVWSPADAGVFVARHDVSLRLGDGDRVVEVPAGSRAVFDRSGGMRFVELSNGVSYERGLDGGWSRPRGAGDGVVVERVRDQVQLQLADGQTVSIPGSSGAEVIRDRRTGDPVAYRVPQTGKRPVSVLGRKLPAGDGYLVRAADGRWDRAPTIHPAEAQAWLAAANKAYEPARLLYDIAARRLDAAYRRRGAGRAWAACCCGARPRTRWRRCMSASGWSRASRCAGRRWTGSTT